MHPLILVLISALLNIAIFPSIDQPWLAPICLFPLLYLLKSQSRKRLLLYFWLAGFLFRAGNLYWIVHVIQHYSQINTLLASGIVGLLCIAMGLLWGITGWILGWMRDRAGIERALIAAPFLWVAFEFVLNILQFPWCLAGYSMYRYPAIAQLASITGVYGLTWLIVAFNAALADLALRRKKYYIYSTTTIILFVSLWGWWRISLPAGNEELTVGVVQGNIPQDVKINYEFAADVNRIQLKLTRDLLIANKVDLVMWSESSTLYPLLLGGTWAQEVFEVARSARTPILVGSDAYIGERVYNSSFLINKNGEVEPIRYSKMYLVPFGEYVPLANVLFFAGKVVPEISDFTPGEYRTAFPLNGRKFAVNICFEVVFPQLARTFSKEGSGLLTTITNDAWFGRTCAPYQHFAMAVMRAIENRRYLIRAANTGISGFVDPYGRVMQKTGIFVPAALTGKVRWIDEQTIYTQAGDIFLYLCIFASIAVVLQTAVSRKPEPVRV